MKKKTIIALSIIFAGLCGCAPVTQKTTMLQEPSKTQLAEQMYNQEIKQDYLNFLHQAKQIMHVKRGKNHENGQ